VTFQQELIQLFVDSDICSLSDFDSLEYHSKNYFISRLYSVFQSGIKSLSNDLTAVRGFKMHYSRDSSQSGFIPPPLEDNFYKKMAFYTSRCIVTCPIEEFSRNIKEARSKRIETRVRYDSAALRTLRSDGKYVFGKVKSQKRTHGGEIHIEGKSYIVDKPVLNDLIKTVLGLKCGINANAVYVLPALPGEEKTLNAALRKGNATRGNFVREELVRQFTENGQVGASALIDGGLTSIYLPHISSMQMPEILDIRDRHSEAFIQFQIAIERFLLQAGDAVHDCEDAILKLLREIDDSVRRITSHMIAIHRKKQFRNKEVVIQIVALAMITLLPPEYRATLAGLLGSITAYGVLKSHRELVEERNAIQSEPFYIAWQIQDGK
jgi:hypothetical protein